VRALIHVVLEILTVRVAGFAATAMLICSLKGPREKGWIGWRGSWKIRRDDLEPEKAQQPTENDTQDLGSAELGEGKR
jgi:hypothetical protein